MTKKIKKRINKVFFIIIEILLWLSFIFNFINGILKKDVHIFDLTICIAEYKNVNPNIEKGDIIFALKKEKYNQDETIVYKKAGNLITHKIMKISQKQGNMVIKTKGEENENVDNWELDQNDIIGKYDFKIPKLGKFIEIFKNKIVTIVLGIILVIIAIYNAKFRNMKKIRRAKRKEYEVRNNAKT